MSNPPLPAEHESLEPIFLDDDVSLVPVPITALRVHSRKTLDLIFADISDLILSDSGQTEGNEEK